MTIDDSTGKQSRDVDRVSARALARALWEEEVSRDGRASVPDERRQDWTDRRSQFVKKGRRILRRLQDDGYELKKPD